MRRLEARPLAPEIGQRGDHVHRPEPAGADPARREIGRAPSVCAPSAAATSGSTPRASSAPINPASTSPLPPVASPGFPAATVRTRRPGACHDGRHAFEQQRGVEPVGGGRGGAPRVELALGGKLGKQRAELARMRGEHDRPRPREGGELGGGALKRDETVGVHHRGAGELEHRAHERSAGRDRGRGRGPARPRRLSRGGRRSGRRAAGRTAAPASGGPAPPGPAPRSFRPAPRHGPARPRRQTPRAPRAGARRSSRARRRPPPRGRGRPCGRPHGAGAARPRRRRR